MDTFGTTISFFAALAQAWRVDHLTVDLMTDQNDPDYDVYLVKGATPAGLVARQFLMRPVYLAQALADWRAGLGMKRIMLRYAVIMGNSVSAPKVDVDWPELQYEAPVPPAA